MRLGYTLAALMMMGCQFGVQTAAQTQPDSVAVADPPGVRVPDSRVEIQLSFAPVVKRAAPAVVNIYTRKLVQRRASPFAGDPFFERFFRDFGAPGLNRSRVENSLGSGVIVRGDGIVVSNHHVVGGADEITVVLNDGREFAAETILSDEKTDLAVLRLNGVSGLPVLKLRDSDTLEIGDLVLAIGNPFGVGQTVTSGIVSALARLPKKGGRGGGYYIQTDAAINPGNSGGALVDMNGALVGVNTSILSRSGGSNGIGFAVPANLVRQVIDSALAGAARFQRPWAGLTAQPVDADLAGALGLAEAAGVLIADLHPKSPFATAGLAPGDVIVALDGKPVRGPSELAFRLDSRGVGGQAGVDYVRKGARRSAQVSLIAAPESPPRDRTQMRGPSPLAGAVIANLNPALAEEIGAPPAISGVIVLGARGAARRIGLRPGDIVREINGAPVNSVADLMAAVGRRQPQWTLIVERDGRRGSIIVQE